MAEMSDRYKAEIRHFMERKGRPIQWSERDRENYPEWPEFHVSTYGWVDHDADEHCRPVRQGKGYTVGGGCEWVVPAGAELVGQTYSQFTDTAADNALEVGINVGPAHCACGQYKDVTLRFSGSLGDVLRELFPKDPGKPTITL